MTLDENDVRASRIVFNDQESEGQALPMPGPSSSGAVIGGDDHDTGPPGESFRSLPSRPVFMRVSMLHPSEENTGDTREEEGEPAESSGGTCQSSVLFALF